MAGKACIYLVGGSSSVGKTVLARELAARLQIDVLHVDELLDQSDDPASFFPAHRPGIWQMAPEHLCELLMAKGKALTPLLDRIVQSRLEDGWQGVIEGEGIQPELALAWADDPRVRCAFVIEESADRAAATLRTRLREKGHSEEPGTSVLPAVARMDAMYGQWLRKEADRLGLWWISSQPFETLASRFMAALS